MYKTLNRVFAKKKQNKTPPIKDGGPTSSGNSSSPSTTPPSNADVAARPGSPLRLHTPSIGEATVKRVVKRLFYSQESQPHSYHHKGTPNTITQDNPDKTAQDPGYQTPPNEKQPLVASDTTGVATKEKSKDVATEVLAFEIGSIMRRMLEIHDSMSQKLLSSLRSNLQAPGVVTLVANDLRVLWGLAGYEKQQELQLVCHRVAVLGRKCNDQRLRKLRVLLDDLDNTEASFQEYSATSEEADMLVRFMREQAEATDNLKSEMESIQLLHTRIQEYGEWNSLQEMVTQGKLVEKLQGHCLWSYNLDYLVQVLVIAICSLRKRIFDSFGTCNCPEDIQKASLGESGLALHYANVVVLLERIIQQPDAVLGPTREELYGMLPRNIQFLLRVQLQDPLNFTTDGRIEANLKRGLLLLPTMAHNTIHWHSRHTPGATLDSSDTVFQVQTFYYANRSAVNAALVDVLLGLCRICGVENPIGFISVQSTATADEKQVVSKFLEEEQRLFMRGLGTEDRENKFGGEVTKTEDKRLVAETPKENDKKYTSEEEEEEEEEEETGEGAESSGGKGAQSSGASLNSEDSKDGAERANASPNVLIAASGVREVTGTAKQGSALQRDLEDLEREWKNEDSLLDNNNNDDDDNPEGEAELSVKRTLSARVRESAFVEDPTELNRAASVSSDVSSTGVARRLLVAREKGGSLSLRKKAHSQLFVKSGSSSNSQEWGRSLSFQARRAGGTPLGESSSSGEGSAASARLNAVKKDKPAGGLVGCFAAAADSDTEGEETAGKGCAPSRLKSKEFSSRFLSRPFGNGEANSQTDVWVNRKTKHYHSQPLSRPKTEDS